MRISNNYSHPQQQKLIKERKLKKHRYQYQKIMLFSTFQQTTPQLKYNLSA
ncbi:unnamed protein product [Paramecium primaurelia]|uniref:Uncharacterized protein n=1 Tax=Paramecium primaurelia TaxID=5886 RepID=A0A8S1PAU5_PARPR|nr:unnamed protein product [Paramecium primaurelia]